MRAFPFLRLSLVLVGMVALALSCNKDSEQLTADALALPEGEAATVSFKKSEPIPGQYIVAFKSDEVSDRALEASSYEQRLAAMKEKAVALLDANRLAQAQIGHTFGTVMKGFVVSGITEAEAQALANAPSVEYVEQDQTISIQGGPPGGGGGGGGQTTPPGITRVNGVSSYAGSGRAWVIDSGVDLDHPDLNVSPAFPAGLSKSFLSGGGGASSPDDLNGHGTHVAGTIAAINNSVGVIGVAPGALVIAVRVLDRNGSGATSGVIAGVDYVGANAVAGDVANMSLGGGVYTPLDNAVIAAANPCKFALAAGNESTHANNSSPGRANGTDVWTISAMNSSDNWASFSNFGNPPVDYCAPGVNILSTWKGGGYNTISGTSMATPHVAGILLLGNIATDSNVSGDPSAPADPIAEH